ncbi:hypothetical protein LH51_16100 [Nitrincola sp. A-D6]|uniref:hypothetical protein n=1 Tax=Nitrincola sp. A-D6 TaxID=1545442 RepID=UPI00051FA047|nr:hypothetical protein [Nitrincola sp. A-D6]KGK41301.1 hypothetical protein LH51_16100 [Nitrincola sp. A-D6]
MKRIITGMLLLLVSALASAASVTISNPTATTGVDEYNVPVASFVTTDTTATLNLVDGGLDAFQPFAIELDLLTSATGTLSFDMATSLDEWTVSIVNTVTNITTQLGNWFVPDLAGELTGLTTDVESGIAYKLLVFGGYAKDPLGSSRNFNLTMSNIEVSEVPLPAAVWLFGSVLLGGLALRRKKRLAQTA